MTVKTKSGKSKLIRGGILFLWEELKTMNYKKLKAISKIGMGYLSMKIHKQGRPVPHEEEYKSW